VPADGIPPASLDYDGSYDAAYDSTADRLYIVSSRFLDQDSLRTLAVSGIDLGAGGHWESVSATGADPGPRFEAAVALLGRELVCIAGRTDTGLQSDAHSLDLDARVWSDLTPIGTGPPTNLTWATAALDSAGARVFVLGGIPSELWTLRLEPTAAWQRVAVTGAGPTAVPIVWDSGGRRLLAVDCGAEPTAQVWALTPDSLPAWSLLETSNPGPVNRGDAAVAFDPRRHRLLVFGGHGTAVYGDLWQLHLDAVPTWDTLPPLFPLYRAKLAYDETRDQLVLFGGYVSQGGLISYPVWVNQTWVRPLDADDQPWASVVASGVPPADLENFVRDPARDRFLYAPSSSSEVWSLVLGPTPAWMPLHPPAVPSGLIVGGPAVMDGARGRLLFPLRSSLGGSELQFTPGVPGLMCPAVGAWSPGSIRDVSFGLVDSEGLELSYEYTLTCQRDWPGFPIRGLASTGGFSTEYVPIHIPIPDSAAFGAVQFGLLVTSREQSGLDTACSFELSGESAPVVPLGGDAEPDRVVVRWRTTRPELTVTIVRRGEGGPWTAVSRQAVVTPGVISYQDHGIQTDQRYYYRAEISDSTSGGAYAQIRVDVPQWSLGFADDQPNPARGQFSVQCSVPAQGPVELDVFDVTGRRSLGTTRVASGPGRLTFDVDGAGRMSPGMYFLRLTQGNQSRRKAIVFLR
jgi:hypothetical protein